MQVRTPLCSPWPAPTILHQIGGGTKPRPATIANPSR
jgi:hypothetical protein